MENVNEGASLEVKWLKKRGFGGKNKDVQFYESFIYDGVEYMLYDCVYMHKEGLHEPYIGKLTKIWERADKTKKVKVHWFFRPEEITNWLGKTKTFDNEILFASGEEGRPGLANINPLEAIAGQCNVVCVSKDSRNPQPSDEQLKAADFVFCRTFDVQTCTISDKMEDKVGGLEIKFVFNREKGENINPLPESVSDTKEESPNLNVNTITSSEAQQLVIKSLPNKLKEGEKAKEIPNLLERNIKPAESDKSHDRPLKKLKTDDKTPLEGKHVEPDVAREKEKLTDLPSVKSKVVELPVEGKSKVNNPKAVGTSVQNSETGKSNKADDKDETRVNTSPQVQKVENKEKNKTLTVSDKLHDQSPAKKRKPDDKKPPEEKPKHEDKLPVGTSVQSSENKAGDKDEMRVNTSPRVQKVENTEKNKNLAVSDKLHDQPPVKKRKPDDKKPPEEKPKHEDKQKLPEEKPKHQDKLPADVNNLKASGTAEETPMRKDGKISAKETDDLEGKMLKKTKDDSSFKVPDNKIEKSFQKPGNNTNGKDSVANSALSKGKSKSGLALGSIGNKVEVKEDQTGASKKKLSMNKSFKGSPLSTDGDKKNKYQEFVVTPKPNAEKSGWFKKRPWEDRLKNAYDQGTAILLYNLDPDYTSGEVEDIIWHAFNESCEAKLVQRTAISSPHNGQALILLKNKEAAQMVLSKLDEECLMLPNKRPLVGTPCPPLSTKKNAIFFGHLSVRGRVQSSREEEAVSTSHYSQPNNIEYDMAMEWCLLQSRSKRWWDKMHKQQEAEMKKLLTEPQPKKA